VRTSVLAALPGAGGWPGLSVYVAIVWPGSRAAALATARPWRRWTPARPSGQRRWRR